MATKQHKVVITGIGMCTPIGMDASCTWQQLINGVSGIRPISLFDASSHKTRIAGEIKGFDPSVYLSAKNYRRMDRYAQFAFVASMQALEQSNLKITASISDHIGVIIGSGFGGISTLYEQNYALYKDGPLAISPLTVPMITADMAAANISIILKIKGPNLCITSACASGSDAIGIAYEKIANGELSAIFAGGAEAPITPIGIAGFAALKSLSTRNNNPQTASRPFDATRDGFVMSEGAAVLLLENYEHAKKRKAHIIAEVASYGACADAYHITHPSEMGEGAQRSMQLALSRANISPEKIGYINAHGTSTIINDKIETQAIKSIFHDYAHKIPISSTKSMTGHLIGAAGAVEAAFCALAIEKGVIPPTINLVNPDTACDLDYVPNHARHCNVDYALSNSFGFGGHNSTLIIKRFEEERN